MPLVPARWALLLIVLPWTPAWGEPPAALKRDTTGAWVPYHPTQARVGPLVANLTLGIAPSAGPSTPLDTTRGQRPKAIEYSDAYHVRLKIHQIGSYLELPLFAAELIVGQKLAHDQQQGIPSSRGLRTAHSTLAAGLGVLFTVNTVTGLWNLWDSRKDPAGRTRRIVHSLGMLAADGGFLATAAAAPEREGFEFDRRGEGSVGRHRGLAIASVSVATLSTAMMWLWRD